MAGVRRRDLMGVFKQQSHGYQLTFSPVGGSVPLLPLFLRSRLTFGELTWRAGESREFLPAPPPPTSTS